MENEKEEKKVKGGKNVISQEDKGDFILQTRKVEREGMSKAVEYDLKIPKTSKAFIEIYGEGELIRLAVASLKTENDDAIEASGKPISEEKKLKTAIKTATKEQKEQIAKILGISLAEAEKKIEETTKAMKKAGFGK